MRRATWVLCLLLLAPRPAQGQAATADASQEATTREHRVQPGETLWSISRAYFGNPFEWRAILEANKERVANPNWIEPGLVLTIPAATPTAAPTAIAEGSATEPSGRTNESAAAVQGIQVTTVPRRPDAAVPAAVATPPRQTALGERSQASERATSPYGARSIFYDDGARGGTTGVVRTSSSRVADAAVLRTAVPRDVFYAAGWLIPVDGHFGHVGRVAGFATDARGRASDRWAALPYDELELRFDGAGANVGDRFTTFRVGPEIEYIGHVARPTGIVTVTRVTADGAVAVLSDEYARVQKGDLLSPLAGYPLVGGATAEATGRDLTGRVLTFQEAHLVKSLGAVAFIDLGRESGVSVGDEFTVHAGVRRGGRVEADSPILGRLQVVGVHDSHSAARITDVRGSLTAELLAVRLVAQMR